MQCNGTLPVLLCFVFGRVVFGLIVVGAATAAYDNSITRDPVRVSDHLRCRFDTALPLSLPTSLIDRCPPPHTHPLYSTPTNRPTNRTLTASLRLLTSLLTCLDSPPTLSLSFPPHPPTHTPSPHRVRWHSLTDRGWSPGLFAVPCVCVCCYVCSCVLPSASCVMRPAAGHTTVEGCSAVRRPAS